MIMDGLDTLPVQHHHHLFLTEAAAAAHHHQFNAVLSFETCLYKNTQNSGVESGSPSPAAVVAAVACTPSPTEPQPGDLNTPVTTSADIPSFFGPSTVVEPPPITGELSQKYYII